MANIVVPRGVYQAITGEALQKRIFVGEQDILLNPTMTPLFSMTTKLGNRKKTTGSTRVEWIEDDYYTVWGQVSNGTTDLSSVATGIPVVDITLFQVGDLISQPNADATSTAEEVMRVTALSAATGAATLTVTRNIGAAGAATVGATADIRIIGSAYAEGAAYGTPRTTTKVTKISYTQIFREPVQVTKSMAAQTQFGASDERMYQRKKALENLRRQIEQAMLWGRASESLVAGAPGTIRTTMGLKSRISTNVYNANTTLTEGGFLTFAEQTFSKYFEGREKMLLASKRVISALDFFSDGKLRFMAEDVVLGVKVKRYHSTHGDFMLVRDLMLDDGPLGSLGFGDEAYAVDPNSIELAPLAGNGENRDTQLLLDVVKDGSDKYADEYLNESASVVRFESRHSRLYNCRAYA